MAVIKGVSVLFCFAIWKYVSTFPETTVCSKMTDQPLIDNSMQNGFTCTVGTNKVKYSCENGKRSNANCERCLGRKCGHPVADINNAALLTTATTDYKNGTMLMYQCKPRFTSQGKTEAVCLDGSWIYPRCIIKDYCDKPFVKNGDIINVMERYAENEELKYTCQPPYKPYPEEKAICHDGEWDHIPKCKADQCDDPELENGSIIRSVKIGERLEVTFQCNRYFKIHGSSTARCQNGRWSGYPECLPPCQIDEIDEKYNLMSPGQTVFVQEGKTYQFTCKPGYALICALNIPVGRTQQVSCLNGRFAYPRCFKC